MLSALKQRLGLADDLPVVIGGLGDFLDHYAPGKCGYFREVNATLETLANELPCAGFVSASGLGCKPDGIHFHSAACRDLGRRYFEVYRTINSKG